MTRLLLFLPRDPDAPIGWLRLADSIAARGAALADLPPEAAADETYAVVPGDEVVVHWAELPPLAPAQAQAAARLVAADVCATPIEVAHVAIGPADSPERLLGIVDATRMADWLARLAAAGIDPDHIVPAPLLIAPPQDGVRTLADGDQLLVRGPRLALAAEPDLVDLLVAGAPAVPLDPAAFETELPAALDTLALDLRQGSFAKRRRLALDRRLVRRLAALAALFLVATLLVDAALLLRHSFAADRAELQVASEARRLLPRDADPGADPVAQVRARLAAASGRGGVSPQAAALFAAVRDVTGAEATALRFGADGLGATLSAANPADLATVEQRLAAAGWPVTRASERQEAGRNVVELRIPPR